MSQAEWDAQARLNYTMGRNAGLPIRLVDWQTPPVFERVPIGRYKTTIVAVYNGAKPVVIMARMSRAFIENWNQHK